MQPSCHSEVTFRAFGDAYYWVNIPTGVLRVYDGKKGNDIQPSNAKPPADQWFTLEIIAVGNSITTLINGEKSVELVDSSNASVSGGLGLAMYSKGSVVRIKNMEINPLKIIKFGPEEKKKK